MDNVKAGDVIGYWENRRDSGQVGNWRRYHHRGLVVKVNSKTLHVKRQLGSWYLTHFVLYGYEISVRVVPRERTYAI